MFTKNILVTGGAGFIGSNFVPYMVQTYPNYQFINLDKLTYAGNLDNLRETENAPNYKFIEGDICDQELVNSLFQQYQITDVIHFAAESHVDNSISGPAIFIKTNIEGTFNLIDTAKRFWGNNQTSRFHHISTDEVYGTLGEEGLFMETTPYAPNSPYSASKASSDFIIRAYHHTYGMNVVTTNCSNNYGPKQHNEKLIPTIIRKAIALQNIPIYGDGKNVRDWLYVLDHCKAIDLVFHQGKSAETYNVGGRNEKTNLEVVGTICSILDEVKPRQDGKKYDELISFVKDRSGHDRRYAIDASKLENELNWRADENFATGIRKTVQWYLDNSK